MIKVYYIVDDNNRVYPICDWSEDIEPDESWYVGEIEAPAYEEHGIPLWKESGGQCVRRTDEEVKADVDALPVPEPTEEEKLRADVDYLLMLADGE